MRINQFFPGEYSPRPCCAQYVRMSERIRAYTEESSDLEMTKDFSYDDASAEFTDASIDFHLSAMDVLSMKLAKVSANSTPKDSDPEDSNSKPAESSAGSPE